MKYLTNILVALVLSLGVFATAQAEKVESAKPTPSFIVEKVNVNHADVMTMAASLKGVGVKKAQAIIDYRKTNGKFTDKNQLLNVKGIGKATLRKNIDKIVL